MTNLRLIRPLEAGTTLAGASTRMIAMWWPTIGIEYAGTLAYAFFSHECSGEV